MRGRRGNVFSRISMCLSVCNAFTFQSLDLESKFLACMYSHNIYSVSQKSSPPKTFCNIFTHVKYISVKFCRDVTSLYLHIFTNFGRFI